MILEWLGSELIGVVNVSWPCYMLAILKYKNSLKGIRLYYHRVNFEWSEEAVKPLNTVR